MNVWKIILEAICILLLIVIPIVAFFNLYPTIGVLNALVIALIIAFLIAIIWYYLFKKLFQDTS